MIVNHILKRFPSQCLEESGALMQNLLQCTALIDLSGLSKNDDIQIYPVLPAFKTTIQH